MWNQSLEHAIQEGGNPATLLRDLGLGRFTDLPNAYTHWIEEQRAWRESCALADQSYHMTELQVSGADAIPLYSDLAVNSFDGFDVGKAKQLVVCNPDGYFIGDVILFHVAEDEFLSVGAAPAHNWIEYHADVGGYDVSTEFLPRPVATGDPPNHFRFQVQGPNAVDVMEAVADDPLPELPFFNFSEVSLAGRPARLFRHGMAGETGFEFWGDYEDGTAVKEAIREVGSDFGLRRLGSKSYQSANVMLGWVPLPLPAIYDGEEMRPFRQWLEARRGVLSIGGSYDSNDIRDYYVTPVELGYEHIIDLEHDFVGKEAVAEDMEDPDRTKVTLEWDPDDVGQVYGSLFEAGETNRFMELPTPRSSACHYDAVKRHDEVVGVSKWMSYIYNERAMLSLGIVDVEHSRPGTELTLVWGEADGDSNRKVERHTRTEIDVTVAPVPYKSDNR